MDNIIELTVTRSRSRRGKPALVDSATVLIFTGVRYDRPATETDRRSIFGASLVETRLLTQEESEIALDLAAY